MFERVRFVPEHDRRKRVREVGRRETKLGHKPGGGEGRNANFRGKIAKGKSDQPHTIKQQNVGTFYEKCVHLPLWCGILQKKSKRDYIFRFRSDFYT